MSKIEFYVTALERLARGRFDFEATDIAAALIGPIYNPSAKDDLLLKDINDELTTDGYDRQSVEGRKVEIKSGQVVLSAKDIKFNLKEGADIGTLVLFDNAAEGKPLIAFKSLKTGDEAYHANSGTLMIELKNGLAVLG